MTHALTAYFPLAAAEARRAEPCREEVRWIARACTGDEAAYHWLLGQYRHRVVRLAAHVLRGGGDAEDVAQETFLRAFKRLPEFRGTGPFSAWLFSITVRLCLDRRRRSPWTREGPETAAPIAAALPSHASDTQILIETLLDQLSPALRAALVLREIEGFEYEEIAAALQIPVGTVRSRLSAARAKFRTLWTAIDEENAHV